MEINFRVDLFSRMGISVYFAWIYFRGWQNFNNFAWTYFRGSYIFFTKFFTSVILFFETSILSFPEKLFLNILGAGTNKSNTFMESPFRIHLPNIKEIKIKTNFHSRNTNNFLHLAMFIFLCYFIFIMYLYRKKTKEALRFFSFEEY